MRLRLTSSLLAFVMTGLSQASTDNTATTASSSLGNVMYVGDSITLGVDNTPSWRWAFHKILVDDGISYTEEGAFTSSTNGQGSTATYGGVAFVDKYSAEQNATSSTVASNITTWIADSTYTTDTFFLLVGQKDLLAAGDNVEAVTTAGETVISNLTTTVGAMKDSNPDATIYVLDIPVWGSHPTSERPAARQPVEEFNNTTLKNWADQTDGVVLVDVNKGIIDVVGTDSFNTDSGFLGVSSMFKNAGYTRYNDGVTLSSQGELILAGNVAKALGYAGRSAGQMRDAASNFEVTTTKDYVLTNATANDSQTDITFQASSGNTSTASYNWETSPEDGFTVDFGVSLTKASTSTWNTTDNLTITMGDGKLYGSLLINEAYIKWGDTVLYSTDMSQLTDHIRVAYLVGDTKNNVAKGFYVWLDDQLIGEALDSVAGTVYDGIYITYDGTNAITLTNLSLDNTGSLAPISSGYIDTADAFYATLENPYPKRQGIEDWSDDTPKTLATSDLTAAIRNTLDPDGSEPTCVAEITSGSAAKIIGNTGDYTGDLWLTVSNEGSTDSGEGFVGHTADTDGGTSNLNGNINIRFIQTASRGHTVLGASNADGVKGNIYMEFSAPDATFSNGLANVDPYYGGISLAGAYNTNIDGNITVVINSGRFSHRVMAGLYGHYGDTTSEDYVITGNTNMYINGGVFENQVLGGGIAGTIEGDVNMTITDGTFYKQVCAGSGWYDNKISATMSNVNGNVHLNIAGGVFKDYIAGTWTNMIGSDDGSTGNIYIEITGGDFTATPGIFAGGGSMYITKITGSTYVTLKNIDANNIVSQYEGLISGDNHSTGAAVQGTRNFILDDYTAPKVLADLVEFDIIYAQNGTNTILPDLGGAKQVNVLGTSTLVLPEAEGSMSGLKILNVETGSVAKLENFGDRTLNDSTLAGTIVLDDTNLTIGENSQLDRAIVELGEDNELIVPETAGQITGSTGDALPQSISGLTGTGTMTNNTVLDWYSDTDASFAGYLKGSGTLNMKGAGTLTLIGAGAEDMSVNVIEGSLKLDRGSSPTLTLGSLTSKQGASVQLRAEAGKDLTVKDGLDLSNSVLDITLDAHPTAFSTAGIITVLAGDINMNGTLIKIHDDGTRAGTLDSDDNLVMVIAKHAAIETPTTDTSTSTDTTDTTDQTDQNLADNTGDNTSADGSASTSAVRRAARSTVALAADSTDDSTSNTTTGSTGASTPVVTADGAYTEISDYYSFYFEDFHLETRDDAVILIARRQEKNPFEVEGETPNSEAGAELINDTLEDDPEGTEIGDIREIIREEIQSGDIADATKNLAAVAGSTINSLGTAQHNVAKDHLIHTRDRLVSLGTRNEFPHRGRHLWIEGTGAYSNQRTRGDEGGYRLTTWGGTAGCDFDVNQKLTLGLAVAADYGRLHSEAAERASGHLNSDYFDIYGRYQTSRWTHTFIAEASWNDAKLNRTVNYGQGYYQTRGDTTGHGFGAMYEAAYSIALKDNNKSILQPFFSVSALYTTMNGYTETGAGNADLHIGKQEWTTATLALGTRWLGTFGTKTTGREWLGEVRANVAEDFGDDQGKTAVSFANIPDKTAHVYGAKVSKTALQLGAGLTTLISPSSEVYANTSLDIRSKANSVSGTIGYRYSF